MNPLIEILANSPLQYFLDQELTLFEYSNGIFYTGIIEKYKKKGDIQPSEELLFQLINNLAISEGKIFNSSNPYLQIVCPPILVAATLFPSRDSFNFSIHIID